MEILQMKIIGTQYALGFIFTIGIIIVGGLYLWTDTKAGKKWLENL